MGFPKIEWDDLTEDERRQAEQDTLSGDCGYGEWLASLTDTEERYYEDLSAGIEMAV